MIGLRQSIREAQYLSDGNETPLNASSVYNGTNKNKSNLYVDNDYVDNDNASQVDNSDIEKQIVYNENESKVVNFKEESPHEKRIKEIDLLKQKINDKLQINSKKKIDFFASKENLQVLNSMLDKPFYAVDRVRFCMFPLNFDREIKEVPVLGEKEILYALNEMQYINTIRQMDNEAISVATYSSFTYILENNKLRFQTRAGAFDREFKTNVNDLTPYIKICLEKIDGQIGEVVEAIKSESLKEGQSKLLEEKKALNGNSIDYGQIIVGVVIALLIVKIADIFGFMPERA